jgi:hypothetical protein
MTSKRWRGILQTAAIRWIDPLFAQRHPGPTLTGAVRFAGPAVRLLQPNDKWSLGAFIEDWVGILKSPPPLLSRAPRRILMFGCYRGQFTRDIIVALLLAWLGHKVTFTYLPKLQSPIKDPLDDSPTAGGYLARVLGRLAALTDGRVTCIDLTNIEPAVGIDEEYLASQVRADTVMRIRREQYDVSEPEVAPIVARYANLGRRAFGIATAYLQAHRQEYDLAVIANGASFENGYFCRAARQAELPVNTYEKFAFQNSITMTHGDAFFNFFDLDRVWARRDELGLTSGAMAKMVQEKAWDLLNQRRTSTGNAWGWQYQQGRPPRRASEIMTTLGVTENGFALVCPNVPFDAGYEGWLTIFPSMREWLTQTIRDLLDRSTLPIVVRAHPAETRPGYGREQIAAILQEADLNDPRIRVVPGDSDINTYDLMPLCRFALVFASTTGVEIAMHAKPVLAGAEVYYARCGVSVPATDRESYFIRLGELMRGAAFDDKSTDAALVYFLFHYLLQWRFPYDKPSQISALPLRMLPSHPKIDTYVETLDVLGMTPDDFSAELPRLVQAARFSERWGWRDSANDEILQPRELHEADGE